MTVDAFVQKLNGLRLTRGGRSRCHKLTEALQATTVECSRGLGRRHRSVLTCGPDVTMEFPCAVVVLPHDDVLALVSNDVTGSKESVPTNFDGCIAVTLHLNCFQTRAREARVDRALPKRTDGRRAPNEVAVCWKELGPWYRSWPAPSRRSGGAAAASTTSSAFRSAAANPHRSRSSRAAGSQRD